MIASEGPIEPWEQAAWERRNNAGALIFAHQQMKEISSLLNENWKIEQAAKLGFFQKLDLSEGTLGPSIKGLAWGGRVYENIAGESRSVHIGKFPFDPNAQYGAYMIDRGQVPGKNGEFYEIVDRQIAAAEVKQHSDADTAFVFAYRTIASGEIKSVYRFQSSSGQLSLADFVSTPPQSSSATPKRVILFGEADEVSNGNLTFSPLWEELRKPPGNSNFPDTGGKPPGDGGKPPGDGGKPQGDDSAHGDRWTSGFWDSGGGRHAQLLRTINPTRAKQNLVALDRQEAARLGPISFFEESDLGKLSEKLTFTPQRGDNAQMVVLVGRNVPELRAAVRAAGEAKLLKGKQVALIMCGDSFGETQSLRESLLSEGALMVWTNDRQITYEAGLRLREHVRTIGNIVPPTQRKTVDQLMNRALLHWYQERPNDPDLPAFWRAASYVLIDREPASCISLVSLGSPSHNFRNLSRSGSDGFLSFSRLAGARWALIPRGIVLTFLEERIPQG